jgi:predicted PurR-regulated permease PerM
MAKQNRIIHDIAWEALFKVLAFVAGIWAVVYLRDVISLLIIVFMFVAAVNPTILMLQRWMSRTLAVVLFFVLLTVVVVGIGYAFIPLVVNQINDLVHSYPLLVEKARPYLSEGQANEYAALLNHLAITATGAVNSLSTDVLAKGATFFSGFVTFLSGLVMSFYLLLEEKNAKEFFHQLLPRHRFQAVYTTIQKISEKMGYWIRGQLIIMLTIAAMSFVAYLAIGVPTPVPLAIWAGICEIIPYIGPWLGMLPAIFILLINGHILGAILVFIVSFIVIQQLESSFVVPRVMSKAIGLSPVFVILALVVGAQLFGVLGAIIAVPAAAIVSVIVQEWPSLRKIWEDQSVPEEDLA